MPLSPKRVANTCLARAWNLLAGSTNPNIALRTREDLRRLALVMGVVAVDAYMHWVVFQRLSDVRGQGELPKALGNIQVPFDELASLAEATVAARKEGLHSRPWVQAKNAAQKRLRRMTLQSFQDVGDAMAMIGVKDGWKDVGKAMSATPADIKTQLDRIVGRRNQIVHEGDLTRQSRPRRVTLNPITRLKVEKDLDFLKRLLEALHKVIANAA